MVSPKHKFAIKIHSLVIIEIARRKSLNVMAGYKLHVAEDVVYTSCACYMLDNAVDNAISHIDRISGVKTRRSSRPADKPSLVNQFRGCIRVLVDAFRNRFRLNRSERSGQA